MRIRGYLGFHKGLAFHLAVSLHICAWNLGRSGQEGTSNVWRRGGYHVAFFIGWALSEKWEALRARPGVLPESSRRISRHVFSTC